MVMGVCGHSLVIALVSSVKSEASSLAENEVGEEVFEAKERKCLQNSHLRVWREKGQEKNSWIDELHYSPSSKSEKS